MILSAVHLLFLAVLSAAAALELVRALLAAAAAVSRRVTPRVAGCATPRVAGCATPRVAGCARVLNLTPSGAEV